MPQHLCCNYRDKRKKRFLEENLLKLNLSLAGDSKDEVEIAYTLT